jgi:8-oxo-dGTP diphosphatase
VSYEFAGSYPEQRVRLTFDLSELIDPGYVLVFPYFKGRLLLTRHKKRGWELPGGTRETGEWPIQTAIREVYEETGAEISAIEPLGQYVIEAPNAETLVKTIYVAQVSALYAIPDGFETEEARLFDEPPAWEQVRANEEYSLILKDDVYRLALEQVRGHRFANVKTQ